MTHKQRSSSSLPEWIEKLTVKTGPCQMCGPKCNDADLMYEALAIAWEALKKIRTDDCGCCSTAGKLGETAEEALDRILDLGGKRA